MAMFTIAARAIGASCCAYQKVLLLKNGTIKLPIKIRDPKTTTGERMMEMVRIQAARRRLRRLPIPVEPMISITKPIFINKAAAPVSITRPFVETITPSFIIQASAPPINNKPAICVHFVNIDFNCMIGFVFSVEVVVIISALKSYKNTASAVAKCVKCQ